MTLLGNMPPMSHRQGEVASGCVYSREWYMVRALLDGEVLESYPRIPLSCLPELQMPFFFLRSYRLALAVGTPHLHGEKNWWTFP